MGYALFFIIGFIIFVATNSKSSENFWTTMLYCFGLPIGGYILWYIFTQIPVGPNGKPGIDAKKMNEDYKMWSNQANLQSKLGENTKVYPVIYLSGHGGVDHYLSFYAHRNSLQGNLAISEDGIYYSSTYTRTEQKFRLIWSDIKSASLIEPDNVVLHINSIKHGIVAFTIDGTQGQEILSQIESPIRKLNEAKEKKEKIDTAGLRIMDFNSVSPERFERFTQELFTHMGYRVSLTSRGSDQGVDLRGVDNNGYRIVIQCKRYKEKVGVSIIRDLYGVVLHEKVSLGILVTSGEFTSPAKNFAKGKPIRLIDKNELMDLCNRYYN